MTSMTQRQKNAFERLDKSHFHSVCCMIIFEYTVNSILVVLVKKKFLPCGVYKASLMHSLQLCFWQDNEIRPTTPATLCLAMSKW